MQAQSARLHGYNLSAHWSFCVHCQHLSHSERRKFGLTSPAVQAPQILPTVETMAEVSTLSGWVSPRRRGPIRPVTGRPSLAPPFLYPLRRAPPLRSGYRRLTATERVGLTLLSNVEMRMGRLRPIVRRVMVPPSTMMAVVEPTRVPFWRRPVSTFGRLPMTDLNHERSLAFSLPSSARPPPDWCSQIEAVVPEASYVGLLLRMSG